MQQRFFEPSKNIIFNLATQVFLVNDEEKVAIKVKAVCKWKSFVIKADKEEDGGNQYAVRLYTDELEPKEIGFMTLNVVPLQVRGIVDSGSGNIYRDKQGRGLSHVYIVYMKNTTTYNRDLAHYEYMNRSGSKNSDQNFKKLRYNSRQDDWRRDERTTQKIHSC